MLCCVRFWREHAWHRPAFLQIHGPSLGAALHTFIANGINHCAGAHALKIWASFKKWKQSPPLVLARESIRKPLLGAAVIPFLTESLFNTVPEHDLTMIGYIFQKKSSAQNERGHFADGHKD
jgi:hypothetical protein